MNAIKQSPNKHHWPRQKCKSLELRPRDLVLRITDWMDDKDEPAFDVEVYVGGVYDWNLSRCCTIHTHKTKPMAKAAAIQFAQNKIAELPRFMSSF